MINKSRQLYSISSEGYLRPVKIMLQLYPQMQDKITLLGFVSQVDKIEGVMSPNPVDVPEELFLNSTHHYLMTDAVGNVSCISEGLQDVGLISQFFMRQNSNFKTVSLDAILGNEFANNITNNDLLISEGIVTQIDTSRIVDYVNVESIAHNETFAAMERQGIYNIHIQLKRFVFENGLSAVDLFRILFLPANYNSMKQNSKKIDSDVIRQMI